MNRNTYQALKLLRKQKQMSITDFESSLDSETIANLITERYIKQIHDEEKSIPGNRPVVWGYKITNIGESKIEDYTRNRTSEIRAWLTAAVAIAAFVKSFFF